MKHLETRKHSKNYGNSFSPKQYQCPSCNKIYESRSGMWKHSKSCDGISEKTTGILTNTGSNLQNIVIEQSKQITELSDMLGEIMKNDQEKTKILKELSKKETTTINNKMSIKMYLNEHCANAIDFTQFVENIQVTLEDLKFTERNGFKKGVSNIFIKNLEEMDKTERPIHCSDQKRLQFYIKNGEWEKDTNCERVKEGINYITRKQAHNIKEWEVENPDWRDTDEGYMAYMDMIKTVLSCPDDTEYKNIMRDISKTIEMKDK